MPPSLGINQIISFSELGFIHKSEPLCLFIIWRPTKLVVSLPLFINA